MPKSQQWNQDENGRGFVPKNIEDAAEMRKLLDKHNYNLYASERISLRRSLPDHRYPECRNLTYPDRLPNISVIIVMHNEAWSMILRTIWSIIDRSPPELLHEIIIVDDASTWDNVKRPLDDYVEMLPARIRILRSTQRIGLIRARLIGARHATVSIKRKLIKMLLFFRNYFIELNSGKYFDISGCTFRMYARMVTADCSSHCK